jgi:serine/threonine-protein kinase
VTTNSGTPPSSAAPAGPPITPGTVLAGKYRVERILGQGGMGVVVEARHIALEERVALKFLLPDFAVHPEASARFLREARAAVKIKSEHVARVSDVGTLDSGSPYMVMEFLEGSDLSQALERTGTLKIEDAIDYLVQGCDALAEAHSYGIVHRDIKPANLFLGKRPDGTAIVKVLDFGISKTQGAAVENLTKTMAAMGSALYMSPEQMRQTKSVDHRTDIYALGITLYELLAGKQPYYAETLPQLCAEILTGVPAPLRETRPDVPEDLARIIEKAYARDQQARFQTVSEFVVALAPFAPERSKSIIDRIARMGGLGSPATNSTPAGGVALSNTGGGTGTQLLPDGVSPGTNPNQIVPGHYQAPHSTRAANAFASGQTNGNLSSTQGGRPASKAPIVVIAIGMLAAAGIAAAFFLRHTPAPTPAADPEKAPTVVQTTAPVVPVADAPPQGATAVATPPPASTPSTSASADPKAAPNGAARPVAPPRPGQPPLPAAAPSPVVPPPAASTAKPAAPKPTSTEIKPSVDPL